MDLKISAWVWASGSHCEDLKFIDRKWKSLWQTKFVYQKSWIKFNSFSFIVVTADKILLSSFYRSIQREKNVNRKVWFSIASISFLAFNPFPPSFLPVQRFSSMKHERKVFFCVTFSYASLDLFTLLNEIYKEFRINWI